MARQRRPFVLNGETVDLSAPGLRIVRGATPYWIARRDAAKRGYFPRTVRLHYRLWFELTRDAILIRGPRCQLDELARRCATLTAEMLEWLGDPGAQGRPTYDGTLKSLIECYQRDPESGYHGLSANTQTCYAEWCRTLEKLAGRRRIDHLVGRDLRKWFHAIMAPAVSGEAPRVRLARGCVRQMMPILLAYGAEIALPNCIDLLRVLERLTLRVPRETREEWKASRPPKVAMTFDQASAIVAAGIAKGTRRHRSVALGVAAQFEFTLRQIDVIGSWSKIDRVRGVPEGTIIRHGKFWRGGLRYEDLASGVLELSTSKTGAEAVFDTAAYPLFAKALAAIPEAERRGPLTVDDSGVPIQKRYYQRLYSELAKAAGVPPEVWNMRARHGGVSEAVDAGVSDMDLGKHAQHSNIQTTYRHYVVPNVETSRRVAKARVAHRQKGKESA